MTPKKSGVGLLQVAFYHANYPEGVRDKVYDLKVLHRDQGYLLALRIDEKLQPVATVILEVATLEWLQRTFPNVADTFSAAEPLDRVLDQLTARTADDFA